ncbi:MAG TPA: hypothetical protein GXX21_08910 [Syntrophomonadaceae bacterium]|nr:hypothetical protein [Syntrophomonadaceae bacterium]
MAAVILNSFFQTLAQYSGIIAAVGLLNEGFKKGRSALTACGKGTVEIQTCPFFVPKDKGIIGYTIETLLSD